MDYLGLRHLMCFWTCVCSYLYMHVYMHVCVRAYIPGIWYLHTLLLRSLWLVFVYSF